MMLAHSRRQRRWPHVDGEKGIGRRDASADDARMKDTCLEAASDSLPCDWQAWRPSWDATVRGARAPSCEVAGGSAHSCVQALGMWVSSADGVDGGGQSRAASSCAGSNGDRGRLRRCMPGTLPPPAPRLGGTCCRSDGVIEPCSCRRCRLASERAYRSPHALHSVLSPDGPRRHSGLSVLPQLVHLLTDTSTCLLASKSDQDDDAAASGDACCWAIWKHASTMDAHGTSTLVTENVACFEVSLCDARSRCIQVACSGKAASLTSCTKSRA